MKTLNLDKVAKQYIIDHTDLAVYEESAKTVREKAQKIIGFIMNEADYPYNRQRLGTDQAIIADHLNGLPSYTNFAIYHYEIIALAEKWGSIEKDASEAKRKKITDNFTNFIAIKLIQLSNGYRIRGVTL